MYKNKVKTFTGSPTSLTPSHSPNFEGGVLLPVNAG